VINKMVAKLGDTVNENNQTDESPGLGIGRQSFGGSSYQQSPAWDINQGSTGPRGTVGIYGPLGSIGTSGFNDREPVNGEYNPGRPSVLKGIVSPQPSVSPTSMIGGSSFDYSTPDVGMEGGPEGTITTLQHSNPSLPQNNEGYSVGGDSSKPLSPEDMTPEQYTTFLFSRESINHNPYKGKE
jgi:hypothetical protein